MTRLIALVLSSALLSPSLLFCSQSQNKNPELQIQIHGQQQLDSFSPLEEEEPGCWEGTKNETKKFLADEKKQCCLGCLCVQSSWATQFLCCLGIGASLCAISFYVPPHWFTKKADNALMEIGKFILKEHPNASCIEKIEDFLAFIEKKNQ